MASSSRTEIRAVQIPAITSDHEQLRKSILERRQLFTQLDGVDYRILHRSRLCNQLILGPALRTAIPQGCSWFPPFPWHSVDCRISDRREEGMSYCAIKSGIWPVVDRDWKAWVERMTFFKLGFLSQIESALILSTREIKPRRVLLTAASYYWSATNNLFVFRSGMTSPSLLEVFALTGLAITGEDYTFIFELDSPLEIPKNKLAYGSFIDHFRKKSKNQKPSVEEQVAFVLYWLSRFIVCPLSKKIVLGLKTLATAIVEERPIALGRFLLAEAYKGMRLFTDSATQKIQGPIWFVQLWLTTILPQFYPSPLEGVGILPAYGSLFAAITWEDPDPQKLIQLFHSDSQFGFVSPFLSRLDEPFSCSDGDKLMDPDFWAIVLRPRELFCGYSSETQTSEVYSPQACALQFGLCQAIPVPSIFGVNYGAEKGTFRLYTQDLVEEIQRTNIFIENLLEGDVISWFPTAEKSPIFAGWWTALSISLFYEAPELIERRLLFAHDSEEGKISLFGV